MSAVTSGAAIRRPLRTSVESALAIVILWHLVVALACAWAEFNILGAVWRLESIPRTAIGIGSAIGIAANLAAAILLWRRRPSGRTVSFTVNYLGLVLAVIALFQSLDLAVVGDVFAAGFNLAFLPFIGLALAVAWIIVGRRLSARLEDEGGDPPSWLPAAASFFRITGLVGIAGFGLWWLWRADLPGLISAIVTEFGKSPAANTVMVLALLGFAWAARTMWSARVADRFNVTGPKQEAQAGLLFLSPNLIGFLLFFAGPLVFSLIISLYDWDGMTGATFVGASNYIQTLGLTVASAAGDLPAGYQELFSLPFGVIGASDPLFWRSIWNIGFFLVLAVPLAVVPALILAVLINTGYRGTKVFRTVFFIPAVAGVISVTLIWKQMFNSTVGFINWFIGLCNTALNAILPGSPLPERVEIGWLSNPSVALLAVVLVFAWSQFGFNAVLFTAGLQGIPREMYEAAELDGAGPGRRFLSVTLPTLRPTTFFVVASTVILALQLFDIVYALNQPNPVGFPDNATLTPVVYLYQLGFQQNSFGRASAVAWVLFAIIFTLTLLQFRRQRRITQET